MKRLLLSAAAVLFAFSANAQISSDTLTYNRGTLGVQAVFPVNINSQSFMCRYHGDFHSLGKLDFFHRVEV
jgi:hypothetical protein